MDITEKLNLLDELTSRMAVVRASYQEMRDGILTPEIKAQLEEVDAEEQAALDAYKQGEAKLTEEIKAAVIEAGATVKGAHLQAVYTRGRESVDMKAFHGYVVAHPEAATLIQTGAPSVSIRVTK